MLARLNVSVPCVARLGIERCSWRAWKDDGEGRAVPDSGPGSYTVPPSIRPAGERSTGRSPGRHERDSATSLPVETCRTRTERTPLDALAAAVTISVTCPAPVARRTPRPGQLHRIGRIPPDLPRRVGLPCAVWRAIAKPAVSTASAARDPAAAVRRRTVDPSPTSAPRASRGRGPILTRHVAGDRRQPCPQAVRARRPRIRQWRPMITLRVRAGRRSRARLGRSHPAACASSALGAGGHGCVMPAATSATADALARSWSHEDARRTVTRSLAPRQRADARELRSAVDSLDREPNGRG